MKQLTIRWLRDLSSQFSVTEKELCPLNSQTVNHSYKAVIVSFTPLSSQFNINRRTKKKKTFSKQKYCLEETRMHHITCCFLLRFSARVCSIKITFSHMRERSLRAFFSVHSTEMLPMWKKKIINLGCLRPWTSITLFFQYCYCCCCETVWVDLFTQHVTAVKEWTFQIVLQSVKAWQSNVLVQRHKFDCPFLWHI